MVALRGLRERNAFTKSTEVLKLEREFLLSSDPVQQWLEDSDYVTVADPANTIVKTKKTDAFVSYRDYRKGKSNGLDRKKFYESLEKKGYAVVRPGNVEHFIGIEVRPIGLMGEPDYNSYSSDSMTIKEYNNF